MSPLEINETTDSAGPDVSSDVDFSTNTTTLVVDDYTEREGSGGGPKIPTALTLYLRSDTMLLS